MVRSLDDEKKNTPRGKNYRTRNRAGNLREPVGGTKEENLETEQTKRSFLTTSMSFRTVLFMAVLMTGMAAALILYIKLQSDVTSTSREVAELEQELMEKRSQNDAAYNEINDSINLEEVREKAINELGMKYADRDQIVIYSGEEKDSVHQVGNVSGK